jgi:hypothetical protein
MPRLRICLCNQVVSLAGISEELPVRRRPTGLVQERQASQQRMRAKSPDR